MATGTDLEVVVVNAADQVAEQHVPGRGDAGHLITGVNVWPLADPDYDEVLITVTLAQAPWTRLASEPIDITTFIAPANGAAPGGREVISHALTEVLTTARHLLADHQNLRQPAGAAARAWQRLRRPLRRV
ncbi:hypothetical protein AGRA3207_007530 [Actinomadura graeca]|uniref:Uncharacterized protein n=1 Tax=Actinomadura graeca TaxID=2750812 RepID=A0ABX8R602_9ACTN|nr:hypothetical protein [Actinomadura graeca]QXJ25961.1 hypothetical protein AGRA3207_007530 [Actinomadura graeca]